MTKLQKAVKKFIKEREWDKDHLYDVLLNIHEEVDEIWDIVKHLGKDKNKKMLEKIILQNRKELEDGIGDLLYLILKLAIMLDVDGEKAAQDRLKEFKKRFPVEKLKGFHGNIRAGGVDYKYQKK